MSGSISSVAASAPLAATHAKLEDLDIVLSTEGAEPHTHVLQQHRAG